MSDVAPTGQLSWIEKLLNASNNSPMNSQNMIPNAVLKSIASMLGTYNPETDRIEAGMRPGVIDDVMSLPAVADKITGLTGHGTHLAGDLSTAASELADKSSRRRDLVAPPHNRVEAGLQGVSDAMVSVPGSQPAKLGKVAKAASVLPRVIYDTVIPVMDFSTKTGKAVAGGSAALGAGLGAGFYEDPNADTEIDDLIKKAQAGDRAAYDQLQLKFPKKVK